MRHNLPDTSRCMHTDAAGRRCRSARLEGDHSVCFFHYNIANRKVARSAPGVLSQIVAASLFPADMRLDSAEAVKKLLTRVMREVAAGSISTRQASSIAYLCQLILLSLQQMKRDTSSEPEHPLLKANPDATLSQVVQSLQSILASDPVPTKSHLPALEDPLEHSASSELAPSGVEGVNNFDSGEKL